ncbi:hypothetical protein [Rhizobium sp. WYJ-E13]|uniref:hypothetical protein n=1 Tax=Rhizobium sp. WYJ-E13 TaxID=2849093 RepID=UPI001C1E9BE4|nr:hypothetical protein [Rhizobium sp. WYJ-E13]QWW70069.1 hypothetical protein KQ933_10400 [Rhizobium sp. WYJ-E13]
MNILKIAFRELIGMFIDDGALALFSLLLVLGVGLAVETMLIGPTAGAVLLVAGCLVILAESVMRAARRTFRR